MKRRIAILTLAVLGMTAGPAAVSGATAAPGAQSNNTILCIGNGKLLGKSVCVPMIKL